MTAMLRLVIMDDKEASMPDQQETAEIHAIRMAVRTPETSPLNRMGKSPPATRQSATVFDQGFYPARSYSLMSPPKRTGA